MDHDALRLFICRKLADGTLPHDSIPRVWGGPGNGESCDACDEIITARQFVMEGISENNRGIQLHVECFYLWDAVRKVPGRGPTPP